MKKKILSAVIAGILALTTITPTIHVSATPSNEAVQESRSKYDELKAKVAEANQKVQEIDNQISPLAIKIDENNNQIISINKEVENTNKEIEQAKVDISEKEEVLGERLREIYKSGGQTSYVSLIFSADSFGDLISKIDTATRLIKIDKKVVQDLNDNKSKLDEKVASLGTKAKEIQTLNEDIQKQKSELDVKRAEQQVFVDKAKAEEEEFNKEFLTPSEREIAQGFMDVANNENSSIEELNGAIGALRPIRKQTKSQIVNDEIVNAIEKAKKTISEKQKAQAQANRGQVPTSSTSAIVNYAYQFLGIKYVYGGSDPSGFDCSGFTSYVYKHAAGISIGRTTFVQINAGREVSRDQLQPGDLVFPHDSHVGIYIGNGQMIHAPQTGDVVKIGPVYSFWRARRIL